MKTIEIIGSNYLGEWKESHTSCRAIIIKDNKLLLSYETKTDQWMIPGGGLEAGESEKKCVIRETTEETGYITHTSECILEIDEYYEDQKFINRYFYGEITGASGQHLTEREKEVGMEPRWLPLDDILLIFSKHSDYTASDEMRRGMYLREYTALTEIIGSKAADTQ